VVATNGVADHIKRLGSTGAADLPEDFACRLADLVDGIKVAEREDKAIVIGRDRGNMVEVKGWVPVDQSVASVCMNELLNPWD